MKSTLLALAAVALVAVPASLAAQETKMARGTASVIADDSLTVKTPEKEMKFAVDSKTTVEAIGGSTKTRQAKAAGEAGPKLTAVLKAGQPVTVSYTESGGVLKAVSIRAIASFSGAGNAEAPRVIVGKVTSVSPTSMVIAGSRGMSSPFTFTIDGSTKVIGKGAGTAADAAGGKTVITELVSTGDTVNVTYHQMGNTMHAAEIRVSAKAAAK
jgi:Domain of unknown function (DUF5666)